MNKQIFALIDCNSFYASCETVFRPDLIGKPIVVLSNNDGCVVALNKAARQIGIERPDPYFKIKDVLHKAGGFAFSSNYELYADLSRRVMSIAGRYTDKIQVYSIDEVFLDLSSFSHNHLTDYANMIKKAIEVRTGIKISVGVGSTKTLAKLANRVAKSNPSNNGVFSLIDYPNIEDVFKANDVSAVWGIGLQYTKKLLSQGIRTIYDLVTYDDVWIKKNLTLPGLLTVWELRGYSCIDLETKKPYKQNIMSGRQFGKPVVTLDALKESVALHCTLAADELRAQGSLAGYIIVTINTNRFREKAYSNSASISLDPPTDYTPELITQAHQGLERIFKAGHKYNRAGVLLGGFVPAVNYQLDLFLANGVAERHKRISEAIDSINSRFGRDIIKSCAAPGNRDWAMKRNFKSPEYTTLPGDIPVAKAM